MTRTLRGLALVAALGFAIVGCAQPVQQTGAKKGKPDQVTAKKPGEPNSSQPGAAKPGEPETKRPLMPAPAKPGSQPPPPPAGPPVSKQIDADKVGLPLYPGAQVTYAQEWTWPKSSQMGTHRSASLTSTDDPEKILKWYQGKFGAKAETRRKDQNGNRKMTWVYVSDPASRVVKSASVMWTQEEGGQPTDVKVYLTVRHLGKPPAG